MKSANASFNNLREHRAVQVLEKAIAANRLAQAILLHGDNLGALEFVARQLAAAILEASEAGVENHPDYFTLRTRGKARQITIGSDSERAGGDWPPNSMRRFIHDLNLTPRAGARKVGVVVEADRMNTNTANAFLKTLEEPPADTTLILLTIRPYDLLDTIRSRCLNFRLPADLEEIDHPDWVAWMRDYRDWLDQLSRGPRRKDEVAAVTLAVYGLISRFEQTLAVLAEHAWEAFKETLPEAMPDDAVAAVQTGVTKSVRQQLFGDIERATRHFGIGDTAGGGAAHEVYPRRLSRAIEALEHAYVLMDRLNLNEATALESFFLTSLRLWPNKD